ncbi:MAG: DNA primase [Lachnospiraceae bacterium]|nr:DNA primase [Lachnospiraceae bacterium]
MYYSDDLVEEIRSRNDIVDVVSSYVKLTKKGSTYFGLCPFHNEKSPSFSVTPAKQMYYCFGCGQGGNAFTFVMKYENMNFPEAVKFLADKAGVDLPEQEYSAEEKKKADLKSQLLEIHKESALYFHKQLKSEKGARAYEYLKGRGLTDETIRSFGLGYSTNYSDDLYRFIKSKGYTDDVLKESGLFTFSEKGVYDKFNNRVMFPIMDINNRVIGFGGRVMGDGKPKYLNSPETSLFDKSRNLYGMNVARSSRKDGILICEGYMDVISLHQAGFNNAVASLGTAHTPRQANLIKRYAEDVYITFDSDGAGVMAALRAIPMLKSSGLNVKVIDMRPHKDPDEFIKALGADEYQKRIDNARNYLLFQLDKFRENLDMSKPEEATKFMNECVSKLVEIEDELERMVYIDTVSSEYNIPKDSLLKAVSRKALTYEPKNYKYEKSEDEQKYKSDGKKQPKDDGVRAAQKTLITWLIDEPELYGKVKRFITKKDFIEEPFNVVADMLFEQLESGNLNPASIINHFNSEEEQSEVASLFNTGLLEGISLQEKEKTLNDTVITVKKNSVDYRNRTVTDLTELQNIMKEQTEISKIHISL